MSDASIDRLLDEREPATLAELYAQGADRRDKDCGARSSPRTA